MTNQPTQPLSAIDVAKQIAEDWIGSSDSYTWDDFVFNGKFAIDDNSKKRLIGQIEAYAAQVSAEKDTLIDRLKNEVNYLTRERTERDKRIEELEGDKGLLERTICRLAFERDALQAANDKLTQQVTGLRLTVSNQRRQLSQQTDSLSAKNHRIKVLKKLEGETYSRLLTALAATEANND